MTMHVPDPAQHSRLVLRESPIPKPAGMDTQLLAVEIPNPQHAILSKERVSMVPAPPPSHQTSKPLLVAEQ